MHSSKSNINVQLLLMQNTYPNLQILHPTVQNKPTFHRCQESGARLFCQGATALILMNQSAVDEAYPKDIEDDVVTCLEHAWPACMAI